MHLPSRFAVAALLVAGSACSLLNAQSIASAHSGTVHYFEGSVAVNGTALEAKKGRFDALKDSEVLTTGQGRAEVLLTPGVFLRIGENSSVKMLDTRLLSTRVELLSGTAMVESDDPNVSVKDPAVTIIYKDYELQPVKYGLFELSSSPSQVKVFKGQVDVSGAANRLTVKEGHVLSFSGALLSDKFDVKNADDLYLWTRDRGAYLSAANMSSAHSIASNNMSGFMTAFGSANSRFGGSWYYNNFLNMYTYMPFGGTYSSPFGFSWYSPFSIGEYYNPGAYYWYGGGGSPTGGSTAGQSISSPSQVARLGIAANHPTLSTPLRNNADGSPAMMRGGAQRGGIDMNGGGFNAATASATPSFNRGGIVAAPVQSSSPSFSAPSPAMSAPAAAAPAASSPGPRAH